MSNVTINKVDNEENTYMVVSARFCTIWNVIDGKVVIQDFTADVSYTDQLRSIVTLKHGNLLRKHLNFKTVASAQPKEKPIPISFANRGKIAYQGGVNN